jgi:hypothetical protein
MNALNQNNILAALGAATAPLCDYYGRDLLPDDVVEGAPWGLVGFPAELVGAALTVVGRTGDGMLVVHPVDDDTFLFRIWPETVTLSRRDGMTVAVQNDAWWASLVAHADPGVPLSVGAQNPLTTLGGISEFIGGKHERAADL